MIEIIQISQLILSVSLLLAALKKNFMIATIIMILLFVVLFFVR